MSTRINIDEAQWHDSREKILATAAVAFGNHGFDRVSMRQIALLCGITPAALYYHFPGKSELYREALAYVFEQRVAPSFDIVESDSPPEDRLRELFRWYARLVADDPEFARLLHREMLDGDEERIAYIAKRAFQQPFCRAVEIVRSLKTGIDAERVTLSAFYIVLGHFEFERVHRCMSIGNYTPATPEEIGMHACNTILAG